MDYKTKSWAERFKVTSGIPVNTKYMVLVPNTRVIQHEGDERSRKYPGHGYPAYTETIHSMDVYALPTQEDLLVLAGALGEENFTAVECTPVKFRRKVELMMEFPSEEDDSMAKHLGH